MAPAIDLSADYGRFAVIPSLVGFLLGSLFVYLSDVFLPQDTVKILTPAGSHRGFDDETSCSSLSELPLGESSSTSHVLQNQGEKARKRIITAESPNTSVHHINKGLKNMIFCRVSEAKQCV